MYRLFYIFHSWHSSYITYTSVPAKHYDFVLVGKVLVFKENVAFFVALVEKWVSHSVVTWLSPRASSCPGWAWGASASSTGSSALRPRRGWPRLTGPPWRPATGSTSGSSILAWLRMTMSQLKCFRKFIGRQCVNQQSQLKSLNKPKMVNAPEGLNQVILRKLQRFLTKKVAKTFDSTHYKLPFINANKPLEYDCVTL